MIFKTIYTTFYYLSLLRKDPDSIIKLKSEWSRKVLTDLGFSLDSSGFTPVKDKTYLLVGNHISYLDIPLLWAFYPNSSFVSKHEIRKWPIFGSAAEKTGTFFVKRNSSKSRIKVLEQLSHQMKENNRSIIIFPSGTTNILQSSSWKFGSFKLAKQAGIQVLPFRIRYSHKRESAYIDRDFFPMHLNRLAKIENKAAFLEFGQPLEVHDFETDCYKVKAWAEEEIDPF